MILPAMNSETSGGRVVRYAEAPLPTSRGDVRLFVFRERNRDFPADPADVSGANDATSGQDEHVAVIVEHVAVVVGRPEEATHPVLVRAHSECLTSEVFGSLKCDCREQLHAALDRMVDEGEGVLLYLRQEGRGIGLGNKIKAYKLQADGADTIEANHQLGFKTDLRTYDVAAGMLHDLGIRNIRLLTNNPEKVEGLENFGINVDRRESIEIAANEPLGALSANQEAADGALPRTADRRVSRPLFARRRRLGRVLDVSVRCYSVAPRARSSAAPSARRNRAASRSRLLVGPRA